MQGKCNRKQKQANLWWKTSYLIIFTK